ncbi:MAG TPA: hypothetical protein VF190_03620 [Rhodothermales bacterium]
MRNDAEAALRQANRSTVSGEFLSPFTYGSHDFLCSQVQVDALHVKRGALGSCRRDYELLTIPSPDPDGSLATGLIQQTRKPLTCF